MIQGIANVRRAAVVRLRVRGPGGFEAEVDAIIDTGFTSYLTLQASTVAALGLAPESGGKAMLGDGSASRFDICPAEVEWGGIWQTILVSVLGNETLLGMRLLEGHKLVIDVVPGGLVEILPLP